MRATDKKIGKQKMGWIKGWVREQQQKTPKHHTSTTSHNQGSNMLKATIQQFNQLSAYFWDLAFIQHDFGLHHLICEPKNLYKGNSWICSADSLLMTERFA